MVRHFLHHYQSNILDIHSRLRRSTIHNDANDYNVLVNGCERPATDVTGMIDFGDAVFSQCVNELAIAVAYGMLGQADPLDMAQQIVGGCHQVFPLTDEEIVCVYSLAAMRLCTSVVISAERQRTHPDDTYLSVSAEPAWDCLRRLQQVSPNFAHFALRSACGKPAHPAEPRLMTWMSDHQASFLPVMKLMGDPVTLDLSVDGQQFALDELTDMDHQPMSSRSIQKYMEQQQRSWAIGRYGEARRCYSAPQYTSGLPFENRWRTIHLGIDLFADAGSPVFAPYPGTVVGVANNDAIGDYGPTVILKHVARIDGRPLEFYSLYGHLDRRTVTRWQTNDQIQAGGRIGSLGTESENGGWPPHLHVQLMLDLLGESTNFPGVAALANATFGNQSVRTRVHFWD
ncbi:MAG: peptidoglycan DD-metalloendopeptidase family protein [Pirellulaceae bacterium]